jgi:hypothetical protein
MLMLQTPCSLLAGLAEVALVFFSSALQKGFGSYLLFLPIHTRYVHSDNSHVFSSASRAQVKCQKWGKGLGADTKPLKTEQGTKNCDARSNHKDQNASRHFLIQDATDFTVSPVSSSPFSPPRSDDSFQMLVFDSLSCRLMSRQCDRH